MIEPLVRFEPPADDYSLVVEAVELSRRCGQILDEEQILVLSSMLARRRDGKWGALEVGCVEPRQNGKGGILEARELAAIKLIRSDRLIVHSAHEYPTAQEAFLRMRELLEVGGDEFQIRRVREAHGEQGFDFMDGTRLRYRTRTKGGARGFSADLVVLDEAMELAEGSLRALFSTLSARENPMIVYTGSSPDQLVQTNAVVLARVRERALDGRGRRLAYFEWGLPFDHPDQIPKDVLEDPAEWRKANPALGRRITEEFVQSELEALSDRSFAIERLGVGDWPATGDDATSIISIDDWLALEDLESELHDPICLWFDVSPDRRSSIAAAGRNAESRFHVELLEARDGTNWLVSRLVGLCRQHGPIVIGCDEKGPAGSLIAEVEEALADIGYELTTTNATQNAQACGLLVDKVRAGELRHRGDRRLEAAIRGAATRPLGDAWSWARRSSSVDISPLFSITLALWAAAGAPDLSQELAIY